MHELAQYYFGMRFHGLEIRRCDYATFKEWYENNYDGECTSEVYSCAEYIWDNCTKR